RAKPKRSAVWRIDRSLSLEATPSLKPSVSRFLDYWQPDCAIIAESEIWTATVMELGRRRIPQILINDRMSDRSFARWRRRPAIA
ncbi:glycosyltransferase N-terminal domain-containing protein, partial [Rhizobium ruizarguesonis]